MKTKNDTHDADKLQVVALSPKQLGTVAALDSTAFSKLNVKESIPATWEERAKKAWEYYTEEPITSNVVDAWKAFTIGDEIKISCDDEDVKGEAIAESWTVLICGNNLGHPSTGQNSSSKFSNGFKTQG